jgi:hypothetical protein
MTTPKIFYQTWKNKDLPKNFSENREKWLTLLGSGSNEWQIPLLTDADLRELVKTRFPKYLKAYDSFTENIERVDFARYIMMYLGGVYADLDTYPLKPIEKWVGMNKIVLGREPLEHSREIYGREVVLCNAFMISPPGQRMWIDLMDFIVENYEPHYKPVYNTGPMAMTLFLEANPSKFTNIVITDPCVFFPLLGDGHSVSKGCDLERDSYVVHVWSNTWVTNPFADPRWKNRRYWFWGLMIVFVILWGILYIKSM